jgi:hypothetical protein
MECFFFLSFRKILESLLGLERKLGTAIPNKLFQMFLKEEQRKTKESKEGSSLYLCLSVSLSLFPPFRCAKCHHHIPTLETPLSDIRNSHFFIFFIFLFFRDQQTTFPDIRTKSVCEEIPGETTKDGEQEARQEQVIQ